MPGPVREADQQHMNQMVQEFTTEETLDQAYKQQARRFEPVQQEMATQSVARSLDQNVLVGFALRNAASLNPDASQTARLKSIKGRNLANIIMNTPGYRRENPELDRIKDWKILPPGDILGKVQRARTGSGKITGYRRGGRIIRR